MDRRLVPLLVAFLALTGGHVLPVRSAGPLSPDVSIAWHRSARCHTERVLDRPAPPSHRDLVAAIERPHEVALSNSLPLWIFQRPPPSLILAS